MAVTIKSSGPRGAKTYEVRVDGQLYHYTDTLADARESAKQARAEQRTESGDYVRTKTGWRRVGPRSLWTNSARKNPTKAQKREKTRKASAKRRVAVALASYLKKVNPAVKLAGARVEKLKGGVLKITPIKADRARCKR